MSLASHNGQNSFTLNNRAFSNRAGTGDTPIYDIASSGGGGGGGGLKASVTVPLYAPSAPWGTGHSYTGAADRYTTVTMQQIFDAAQVPMSLSHIGSDQALNDTYQYSPDDVFVARFVSAKQDDNTSTTTQWVWSNSKQVILHDVTSDITDGTGVCLLYTSPSPRDS